MHADGKEWAESMGWRSGGDQLGCGERDVRQNGYVVDYIRVRAS